MKYTLNKGFTLVELIVVIIIVGVLAVSAAPRFIDISSDARTASLEALKSALDTGARLVFAKALIQGKTSGVQTLDINNDGTSDIAIRSGYPRVRSSCSLFLGEIEHWMNLSVEASCTSSVDGADWFGVVENNAFHFFPSGYTSTSENCYVTYTTASEQDPSTGDWVDTDSAAITLQTNGC